MDNRTVIAKALFNSAELLAVSEEELAVILLVNRAVELKNLK